MKYISKIITHCLFLFIIFSIMGCSLTQREAKRDREGIEFVQQKVDVIRYYLALCDDLTDEEQEYIKTVAPETSVYMWGTGKGSFGWWWEMPNATVVSVSYAGGTDSIDFEYIEYYRRGVETTTY